MDEKIEGIIKKFENNKNPVEILQEIQKEYGYISRENMESVSRRLGIPLVKLYGVATFYALFKLNPEGKYRISVCRGTACHVKKSKAILDYLEKKLKIKSGETTPDALYSLHSVNCLGACAKAPAMMINDVVYGELSEQKVDKIIEELK